tara:strand:+ start:357 stop:653 length:297 start_codon:yes stop_codon:yes gene_type:complete
MAKIKITQESRERVIKAPIDRRFWYRLTFGKWGELFHKQHYMVNVFHSNMDNRTKHAHSLQAGFPYKEEGSSLDPSNRPIFNCRCSLVYIQPLTVEKE